MKRVFLIRLLAGLLAIWGLAGCDPAPQHSYVIGISQCMTNDEWRQAMIQEVMIEAANYDSLEIVVCDAHSNSDEQIRQVRDLIRRHVDILVVSPFESAPLAEAVSEAYRAGIPTIVTDRRVNTDEYTTFIGADNRKIGELAGEYAANQIPTGGKILELWGAPASSPSFERHEGFRHALEKRPDLVCDSLHGDWLYEEARQALQDYKDWEEIDLVYAHNDLMALAAREILAKRQPGRQVPVVGVDAVTETGLQALASGKIDMSFLYPTGGERVIRTAVALLRGENVPKEIPLYTTSVDREMAQTLLLQNRQRKNYQERIVEQKERIARLLGKFEFLQSSLWLISLLTFFSALSLIYVYLMNNRIIRINRELREKNQREEEQNRELISLNAEIKEVTAQKMRLFTDVSHEVRTPLTLILSPLEQLLGKVEGSPYEQDIRLVHRNAARLLRVINQVLDFQRMENGGQDTWRFVPVDLVSFLQEVKTYFDGMAAIRQINFGFECQESRCDVYADKDKLEKVIVNLLSNAFKFTSEKGTVLLRLEADEHIYISVEDNGSGIGPERIHTIFERFQTGNSRTGSGIGLYLVKKYVERHGGTIRVESNPGVRTCFTVELQKGTAHLRPEEIGTDMVSWEAAETLACHSPETERLLSASSGETVLLVEDEREVRDFLYRELEKNFRILTADSGEEALVILADETVSLVLSDVMMPGMNGFELCKHIKQEETTGHIPVLLLTALTDTKHQIYGISEGADGYIRKPFHIDYLKVRIAALLEERRKWQQRFHLLVESQTNRPATSDQKYLPADEQFIHSYLNKLEEHYTDSDFNIERLSEELALSRGHLYRRVKELTGLTPVESLRNYRLEKAMALLLEHRLTVSEVAYACGFTSPAYFAKCFKQLYRKTPSEI